MKTEFEVVPRELFDPDDPSGYLVSDREYVESNLALAVHMLDCMNDQDEAEFFVFIGDEFYAGTWGQKVRAFNEAMHFATVAAADGETNIRIDQVVRVTILNNVENIK